MSKVKTNLYKISNGKMKEISVTLDEATEIYKKDPLEVYPKEFFKKMVKLRNWQNDAGRKICKTFNVKSVVDFGCASGYYLEGFHEMGAEILGYEYAYKNTKKLIPNHIKEFIKFGDAQEPLFEKRADMSFSIEVAEHILPEKSEQFVENLCRSGDMYVVFSAATPGQGGTCHINERPFADWKEMFAKHGYIKSKNGTKELRNIFKSLPSKGPYVRLLSRQVVLFLNMGENIG